MSFEEAYSPSQWEESPMTKEQMALSDVAYHLQTYASAKHTTATDSEDVLEEAQLLLSLLSSHPLSQKLSFDEEADGFMRCQDYHEQHAATSLGTFSFTCPALSLERNFHDPKTVSSDSDSDAKADSSYPPASLSPPPAILLARTLNSDDPSALRESAESLGRNVLRSFDKALEWRTKTWIDALSRPLVKKEQELNAQGATEQDLRELLKTAEARAVGSLRIASSQTELLAARTSFRVLPQRINTGDDAAPPMKKTKVEDASLLTTETSYTYRVSHAISFETVIDLHTPAGYAEVTLEAPGIIEGTFLSTDDGAEELTDVKMQIDTHVLATMMERSTRVVVKASSEAVLEPPQAETPQEKEPAESTFSELEFTSPKPYALKNDITEGPGAVIVTPRYPSPPSSYTGDSDNETNGNPVYFPLPGDMDDDCPIRMVSPQPRSPDLLSMKFKPRTPSRSRFNVPTLVSPRTTQGVSQQGTGLMPTQPAPLFPSLVEAACAAMQHAC